MLGFKLLSHTNDDRVVAFLFLLCLKLFLCAEKRFLKLLEYPIYVAVMLLVFIVALYKMKKEIIALFKTHKLSISIDTKLETTNFLDNSR